MNSEEEKKRGLLTEITERREGFSEDADENPYWLEDEAEPHPTPELGCIRRNLCCRNSPGWFGPGEVERAAEFLGIAPDQLVRESIIIDHIELDGARVEVFAPVKIGRDGQPLIAPATRADRLYQLLRSPCVFFGGDGCSIYGARPIECRHFDCTNPPEENMSHRAIAEMWRDDS